jgi:hypothetical protein
VDGSESQRRCERFDVTVSVTLTLVREGRQVTVVADGHDVSKGGMCLSMTPMLRIGESFLMEFVLPYNSTPLSVRGVVRNENGLFYGVEFLSPTAHQKEMLERNSKVLGLLK